MDTRKINDAVRTRVLSSTPIRKIIQDRIFPSELAQLKDPTFPLINFKILPGSPIAHTAETLRSMLMVWAWSRIGYDEAASLLHLVQQRLIGRVETSEINMVLRIEVTPESLYDSDAGIYGYVMRFDLYAAERS